MFTVTLVESPLPIPAVPWKVGVVLLVEPPLAGLVSVTVGATVSIVNVRVLLDPVFPAESDCCACAV